MDNQDAVPATQNEQRGPVSLTILRPTKGTPCKVYDREGKRESYDSRLLWFYHHQVQVHDTSELHALIKNEAKRGESFIIPGAVRNDASRIVNRRKHPKAGQRDQPDVVDAPVEWGCIDVDSLPCPIHIPSSAEAAARYVIEQIGTVIPGFERLTLVIQASNSAGQPGNEYIAKFHIWFLLDRPWQPSELKEIAKKANQRYRELNPDLATSYRLEKGGDFKLIDDALFQATQPNFVADPKFVNGAVDPMPYRVWLHDGDHERLKIEPKDFLNLPTTTGSKVRNGQGQQGKRSKTNKSAPVASEHREKVTKPCHITGNHSRNRFFIRAIKKALAQFGPKFDRQAMVEQLRQALKNSKADPADIQRWSTDAYLSREIEDCVQFTKRHVVSHFGLNPAAHHQLCDLSQQYLPLLPLMPGVLLVKSPMNSGKTHALERQVLLYERVLVLVHRQSLAKELARRLNLACYLDIRNKTLDQDRMVVCINSLHKVKRTDFDLVVIEESEQLIRSLANLKIGQKPAINHETFQQCVRRAGQVVALDAQMSNLTLHTLESIRRNERFTIWRNTFDQDKVLRCYPSRAPLILAYDWAVESRSKGHGQPVALLSNSRTLLHQQYERIRKEYPQLRIALITSKTTGDEHIQELLKNFDEVGEQYDVILASPSMSTGISIEKLDFRVFGAFDAEINCHTDVAQAISRFRLARQVDVFIAEGKMPIDSGQQIVEARLQALYSNDIPFINDGSQPSFRADLYLRVLAYEERSKGLLAQNFNFLADEAGWTLQFMRPSKMSNIVGASLLDEGRRVEDKVRTERLLAAKRLTDRQLEELATKQLPTSTELDNQERSLMERFYCRPITEPLIKRDHRGARQKAIRNLELVRDDADELLTVDRGRALGPDALSLNFKSKAVMKELWSLFLQAVGLPINGRLEDFYLSQGRVVHRPLSSSKYENAPAELVFAGWSKDTLDPAMLKAIDARRVAIKAFLGRTVPKDFFDDPISFINQMLTEGLAIPICSGRPRNPDTDKRIRQYTLDIVELEVLKADLLRRALGQAGLIDIDDPDDALTSDFQDRPVHPSSLYTSKPGGGPEPDPSITDCARRHDTYGKESQSPADSME